MLGMRRAVRGLVLALALGAVAGCRSAGPADLADLAAQPPLPYSVLVSGGAFVDSASVSDPAPWLARTYRPQGEGDEVLSLEELIGVLRRGRVFVQADQHRAGRAVRQRLAALAGPVPLRDSELQAVLEQARRAGYDLLLVVERLRDGPVEARGVNGQWPITLSVWLLIGLGMVIPDHTYESRAQLHVTLREVQTGRQLYSGLADGGAVDLALVERTDWLGLLQSVVVPPFWVGDDPAAVEAEVRAAASSRLLESMARELKSADVQTRVEQQLPAQVRLSLADGGVTVVVDSRERLAAVRLRRDSVPQDDPGAAAFERQLLASEVEDAAVYRYRASLPRPAGTRFLQVLVQTVTAQAASATLSMQ